MWQIFERNLMKVQFSYNVQFNNAVNTGKSVNSKEHRFGLIMAKQLTADTVSFQGRVTKVIAKEVKAAIARKDARAIRDAKLLMEAKTQPTKKNLSGEERKQGVSNSTAKKIRSMILMPQKQIHEFMDRIFGDLKVSSLEPKNLILDFSDRAKSVISIAEKSATRDLNSIEEVFVGRVDVDGSKIEGITDLNAGKIVMNYKTGKTETENVLSRLIPLIKTGQVTLHEIELQRPSAIKAMGKKEQEEFDYVSKAFLDKLEDAQEEFWNGNETNVDKIKLINRPLPKYTKFNYCALHLILQLNEKGSRPFEMQIMGAREGIGKYFDDKRFKFFDGKELDKKYAPLITLWKRLLPEENAAAKEEFFRYCKEANLQIRKDEIQENETQRLINRHTGLFKTVREYNLPPEYDLNEQYKLMLKCENKKTAEAEIDNETKIQMQTKKEEKAPLISKKSLHKLLKMVSIKKEQNKDKIKI